MIRDERVGASRRFGRIPRHVGLIPDGNRRWARERGLHPAEGYMAGVQRGLQMLEDCRELGIEEVSVYGFTQDNTKRPADQRAAFTAACVAFVANVSGLDVALRVLGDHTSRVFPEELKPYALKRIGEGLKVNMLVNYGWQWDLEHAANNSNGKAFSERIGSADASRIDLIVRWGGCRRLSGFLPVQSVYADFYVVDEYWPDYEFGQFLHALQWYQSVERTLGG